MDRQELERLTREQLIALAERLGISRPRVLTQPELIDEIIGRTAKSEREKQRARGWLGRARDLLARVVERGLHLPEAARVLRSTPEDRSWPTPPPPLPTVTLAEIYAAQGHLERAIGVLDEVLAREPDHQEARSLRARFADQAKARSRARSGAGGEAPPAAPPAEKREEAPIAGADARKDPEPAPASAATQPEEVSPITAVSAASGEAEARKIAPEAPKAAPEAPKAAPSAPKAAPEAPKAAPSAPKTAPEAPKTEPEARRTATEAHEAEAQDAPIAAEEPGETETALPERYDVDEIVAIAVDPRTVYLYWEARATTLAHARARRPDGWLCLRIVGVTASWSGPVVKVRDARVDALYGDRFVREVEPGSNVRVSVGWMAGGEFEPFAIGIDVTVPHLAPTEALAQEMAVWTPTGSAPTHRTASPAHTDVPLPFIAHSPPARLVFPVPMDRPPATRAARRQVENGPVDTGVEVWTEAQHSPRADEVALAQAQVWPRPVGASDLPRGGPHGGGSELSRWSS